MGCLGSAINVGGADYLRRRGRPEQTPVQRHVARMYERREEAWRGLTRERVDAFIRLFILCLVELENGLPLQTATYRLLKKKLVKKVIPWIIFAWSTPWTRGGGPLPWDSFESWTPSWPSTCPESRKTSHGMPLGIFMKKC